MIVDMTESDQSHNCEIFFTNLPLNYTTKTIKEEPNFTDTERGLSSHTTRGEPY